MAPPGVTMPSLKEFFGALKVRITKSANGKAHGPIQAISEGHDSFLIDSIAKQNGFFNAVWTAEQELDSQDLVDAFVDLVTAVHKWDGRLQKIFDKLVPKKTSELGSNPVM